MKLSWEFEDSDIRAVQEVIHRKRDSVFVRYRIERNVEGPIPDVNKESLWRVLMMCLLTSQQRSGPSSSVTSFLKEDPFPITVERCQHQPDLEEYVYGILHDFGGIRFTKNIAERVKGNFDYLEGGGWLKTFTIVNKLREQRRERPRPEHHKLEREAAEYMDQHFKGIGPKQSRNFWQSIGLSRYEFVLDSRIVRWLKELSFPFPLSSNALGDRGYYYFISDISRELCIKANELPCILDAAIFASYDQQEWTEDTIVW